MTAARDPIAPLQDIVKKAEQIERLLQGMALEEFLHDERIQLALGMAFIDLGNAHGQLTAVSRRLAAKAGTVAVEGLNVKGMPPRRVAIGSAATDLHTAGGANTAGSALD